MSNITHSTTIRNGIADYVTAQIDAGAAGDSKGHIFFQTSASGAVADLKFSTEAFGAAGAVVAGRCDAAAIEDDNNCTAGTVDKFVVKNSDDDTIFSGTVTTATGTGDIILSSVEIELGDTISISSLTYAAPV